MNQLPSCLLDAFLNVIVSHVERRPENVPMNQLPSCLFDAFLNVIISHVVLCNVASQSADDDHSDDAREEEHNHNVVDNGEPVDLGVLHIQVHVPTGSPLHFTLLPLNGVGEVQSSLSIL